MTTIDTTGATDLDLRGDTASADPGPPRHPVREVLTFLAPVYVIALILSATMPGTADHASPASFMTLFVPALTVGVLRLIARRRSGPANPHPFGLRRPGLRSWPAALVLSVTAICVPFAIAWAFGVVTFPDLGGYALDAPFSIVFMSVLVMGEEIGWRGYVLPRLTEVMPVRRAALATGFAQALMHLPLLLLTPTYLAHGNRVIVVPIAVLVISAAGPYFGWLRVRSGSLWPSAIAHATVNTCLIEAPFLASERFDLAAYLAGEGGILTLALVVLVSAIIVRRADWTPRSTAA